MVERGSEKLAIIMFGYSQTGKSSFINHISRNPTACKVFDIGTGRSCTQKASCHGPFTTRGGQEVLLVDTAGLNDTDPRKTNDAIKQTLFDQMVKEFITQINDFKPDRIVFGVTESMEGDTMQFTNNLNQIMTLFGRKAFESVVLILTKYNPNCSAREKKKQDNRYESIKKTLDFFKGETKVDIKHVRFHTNIVENGRFDPELSVMDEKWLKKQEDDLFANFRAIKSYPVSILKNYDEFITTRIKELHLQKGVVEYKTYTITYEEKEEEYETWAPRGDEGGIFSFPVVGPILSFLTGRGDKFELVTRTRKIQVPKVEEHPQRMEVRSEEDIKKLYLTDAQYLEERNKKIDELIANAFKPTAPSR